jgi:hypothetical protein
VRALGPLCRPPRLARAAEGRPFAALALGLALYTSLVSLCCGFGVVAAPWFACELLALLLGVGVEHSFAAQSLLAWAGLIRCSASY